MRLPLTFERKRTFIATMQRKKRSIEPGFGDPTGSVAVRKLHDRSPDRLCGRSRSHAGQLLGRRKAWLDHYSENLGLDAQIRDDLPDTVSDRIRLAKAVSIESTTGRKGVRSVLGIEGVEMTLDGLKAHAAALETFKSQVTPHHDLAKFAISWRH